MAEVAPGGSNTFVPTFSEATGQIQVEFTRSPNSFPITQYCKLIPVSKSTGYYLSLDTAEASRIVSNNDYVWRDGNDAPEGNQVDHDFTSFTTDRFANTFTLGHRSVRNADWDIVAAHARVAASKAMRLRTKRAAEVLLTSGNWGSASTGTCSAIGGGKLDASGASDFFIQKAFNGVVEKILDNTGEAVSPRDIVAIMGTNTAHQICQSAEYHTYFNGSPFAANFVRGAGEFDEYALLSNFFGIGGIVVDTTSRITTRKGATETRASMFEDDIVFVSRPGGLMGTEGVPDFSTISCMAYEDMTVETMDDTWNRRTRGRVVDDSAIVLTAPLSGFLLTDCVD
tara:strand:- start:4 stop:1026 length:1023 start_codon:yes stop_codon:yes gene_type:complete